MQQQKQKAIMMRYGMRWFWFRLFHFPRYSFFLFELFSVNGEFRVLNPSQNIYENFEAFFYLSVFLLVILLPLLTEI